MASSEQKPAWGGFGRQFCVSNCGIGSYAKEAPKCCYGVGPVWIRCGYGVALVRPASALRPWQCQTTSLRVLAPNPCLPPGTVATADSRNSAATSLGSTAPDVPVSTAGSACVNEEQAVKALRCFQCNGVLAREHSSVRSAMSIVETVLAWEKLRQERHGNECCQHRCSSALYLKRAAPHGALIVFGGSRSITMALLSELSWRPIRAQLTKNRRRAS